MSKNVPGSLTGSGARRSRPDFEKIKRTTDIAAVIAGYGVEFRKQGRGHLAGRCPFPEHDDKKPSFIVSFHCAVDIYGKT